MPMSGWPKCSISPQNCTGHGHHWLFPVVTETYGKTILLKKSYTSVAEYIETTLKLRGEFLSCFSTFTEMEVTL